MSVDCIASLELFVVPPGWLFLKVTTEEGRVGWGEPAVVGRPERVATAVQDMADFVAGHPVDRVDDLFPGLHRGGLYQGGPLLWSAISGLEQALWDIKGHRLGLPVHDMLGGVVRQAIPAAGWVESSDRVAMAEQVTRHLASGFGAVVLRVSARGDEDDAGRYAARVVSEVETVRRALGEAPRLAAELQQPLPAELARSTVASLEVFKLLYLGNAVESGALESWMDVSGGGRVRLARGRAHSGTRDLHEVVTAKQADVIQPDLCCIGGAWEMVKLAELAERSDVVLAPAGSRGPIALAASLQVGFAVSGVLLQESSVGLHRNAGVAPADYLCPGGDFMMREGAFEPNRRPGLGIVVNEELVRELHEKAGWWANPVWRDDLDAAVGW
jgi:galactonate dehydratase